MPIILEASFLNPSDSQQEITLSVDLSNLNSENLKKSIKEYSCMQQRVITCKKILDSNLFTAGSIWWQEQIGYHGAQRTMSFLKELDKKNSASGIFMLIFDTVKQEPESKFSKILMDWFLQKHVDKNKIIQLAEFFKNEKCFILWAFDNGELSLIHHKSLNDASIKNQLQQGFDDDDFKQWRYEKAKIIIFNQLQDSFAQYQLEIEEMPIKKRFLS